MMPSKRHTLMRSLLPAVAASQVLFGAAVLADWRPAAPVDEIGQESPEKWAGDTLDELVVIEKDAVVGSKVPHPQGRAGRGR